MKVFIGSSFDFGLLGGAYAVLRVRFGLQFVVFFLLPLPNPSVIVWTMLMPSIS